VVLQDNLPREVHDAKDAIIAGPMIGQDIHLEETTTMGQGGTKKMPSRRCTKSIDFVVKAHALTSIEPLGHSKPNIAPELPQSMALTLPPPSHRM
jgi:hypothetical protein